MLFKIFVVLVLLAVIASLFSGLFFMFRDRPNEADAAVRKRTVRALTTRVALSLLLFAVLILGYHWGWYSPGAVAPR